METNQLIIENVSPWDFDKTVDLLTLAASGSEWNIPVVHDLQQSLAKDGKAVKPVKVLEICKSEFSGRMLEKSDERIVSVMMPCRISIYIKDDGKTYVASVNPEVMAANMPDAVRATMKDAADEVIRIIDSVIQ